ncbi:MAG TPA: hypothetical protein VKW04_15125 [Planctomycetota bacterium]|nr:hypothetical protein [Planctomycetota bacterium]
MTCEEFRGRVTVHLAEGSEEPGDHGDSCVDCGRYRELARAAWEVAGKDPDRPVPDMLLRSCRRSRRSDLTLLRPGSVAAAAILAVAAILVLWPAKVRPGSGPLMDADGTSVERYDLPAGAKAEVVAEELRRSVAPETWGEGISGLETGDGFLRVRAPAEVQKAVRDYLNRRK